MEKGKQEGEVVAGRERRKRRRRNHHHLRSPLPGGHTVVWVLVSSIPNTSSIFSVLSLPLASVSPGHPCIHHPWTNQRLLPDTSTFLLGFPVFRIERKQILFYKSSPVSSVVIGTQAGHDVSSLYVCCFSHSAYTADNTYWHWKPPDTQFVCTHMAVCRQWPCSQAWSRVKKREADLSL